MQSYFKEVLQKQNQSPITLRNLPEYEYAANSYYVQLQCSVGEDNSTKIFEAECVKDDAGNFRWKKETIDADLKAICFDKNPQESDDAIWSVGK